MVNMNNGINENGLIQADEMKAEEVEEVREISSSRRSRKKPRVKKKRRKKYYLLRLLILVFVCVGVYFFMHSDVFVVKKIEVEENGRYGAEQIMEMTGLKKGMNMFEIHKSQCEAALEENPYISSADITRDIPDTLNVKLELRTPIAVIVKDDKYIMIDRTGFVLEKRDELPYYTVIDGITPISAKVGDTISVKEEKLYEQYMEIIDAMNSADLYFREIEIKGTVVKLYVRKQLYCVGEKENILEGMKDGNLKTVLYRLSEKDIEKGVVSVGDNKYYSFNKSAK